MQVLRIKKNINAISPWGDKVRPFDKVLPASGNQSHFQDINPSQNRSDPFNTDTKNSSLEWWKKKWENFEIFDLKEHLPKTLQISGKLHFPLPPYI